MTDITEKLLACEGIVECDPECHCAEAAAEIKRLRAALLAALAIARGALNAPPVP
jgi:hypothetical protein